MGHGGWVIFSSPGRSSAFLEWAWTRRDGMSETERHGLAQAIYAALIGHVEATMFSVLEEVHRRALLSVNYASDDLPDLVKEGRGATMSMLRDRRAKIEAMTFEPLFAEIAVALYPKFDAGPKRHRPDLEAIRDLRNVFVHGRSLTLPLALEAGRRIDTDGTKLKLAVDRLITAGVIDKAATRTTKDEAMGGNEAELLNWVYSDAAVLHFVQIGRTFQQELSALWPCPPEVAAMNKFPDLRP